MLNSWILDSSDLSTFFQWPTVYIVLMSFFPHFGHCLLGSYRACRTTYIGRHVNIDRVEILFMGHHIKTIFFNTKNLLKVWQSFRNPFGFLNQWWCLLLFATGMNRDQGYNPAPIYGTILQLHQNGAANNSKRHHWVGSESSVKLSTNCWCWRIFFCNT